VRGVRRAAAQAGVSETRVSARPPRTLAGAGWARPEELPRGPGGRALCRYCGREVPPGRRTFCSGARARFRLGRIVRPGSGCVHEWCVRSNPGYARRCVYDRDRGVCAGCGAVTPRLSSVVGKGWQVHHVVAVAEGGGCCGLDGLATLCAACHRRETSALVARIALRRNSSFGDPAA